MQLPYLLLTVHGVPYQNALILREMELFSLFVGNLVSLLLFAISMVTPSSFIVQKKSLLVIATFVLQIRRNMMLDG